MTHKPRLTLIIGTDSIPDDSDSRRAEAGGAAPRRIRILTQARDTSSRVTANSAGRDWTTPKPLIVVRCHSDCWCVVVRDRETVATPNQPCPRPRPEAELLPRLGTEGGVPGSHGRLQSCPGRGIGGPLLVITVALPPPAMGTWNAVTVGGGRSGVCLGCRGRPTSV